jgi:hypothetical protein
MAVDLDEDGADFILRRTAADGTISELRLSEEDVMAVSQSAPIWRDRLALRRSPASGDVTAVVVTPVTAVGIQPDSLKESVLLTLQSNTRGRLTFGLSPRIIRLVLKNLLLALNEIESANPTRQ